MTDEQYESLRKQNAEILNYLSSIARDMGEFKQETLKRLDNLESRLSNVEERLKNTEKEIAGLKTEVIKLTDQVESLELSLGHIANDVLKLRTADSKLGERINKLEEQAA